MMYHLSCPSKTFFIGEYAILQGAPAFILNTTPRFSMKFIPKHIPSLRFGRFHPLSPIGRWMRRYAEIFRHYRFQFYDPHHQKGGCGASTAQFLMAYLFSKSLIAIKGNKEESCFYETPTYPFELDKLQHVASTNENKKMVFETNKHSIDNLPNLEDITQYALNHTEFSIATLLKDYLSVAWDGNGIPPSGADLISQYTGSITYFDKSNMTVADFPWPFDDLSFLIVRTGHKIATHHHLQKLASFTMDQLNPICHETLSVFKKKDASQLIYLVSQYAETLKGLGFVAEKTEKLLTTFRQLPEVLAAKGCGAMGADMMIFLCKPEHLPIVKAKAKQLHLHYIADEGGLTYGAELI